MQIMVKIKGINITILTINKMLKEQDHIRVAMQQVRNALFDS